MDASILSLVSQIQSGDISIHKLTTEQRVSIINAAYGDEAVEYREIASSDMDEEMKRGILNGGVKTAIQRIMNSDEYWSFTGEKK